MTRCLFTKLCSLAAGSLIFSSIGQLAFADTVDTIQQQFKSPIVVHGLTNKTSMLPDGDVFEFPGKGPVAGYEKGLKWTVQSPAADPAQVFNLNEQRNDGRYPLGGSETEISGLNRPIGAQGISLSASGKSATALTCTDQYWDLNFVLAGLGDTAGDRISFFLQSADKSESYQLVAFRSTGTGVILDSLHYAAGLWEDNRLALGMSLMPSNTPLNFSEDAAFKGKRTKLLTLTFMKMGVMGPWNHKCLQLGVQIDRADGEGTTSVAITDVVGMKSDDKTSGDGAGLIARPGLIDIHPLAPVCESFCPVGPDAFVCKTMCFKSPEYWRLNFGNAPKGTVYLNKAGQRQAVGIDDPAVKIYLNNQTRFPSPMVALNRQYIAAQLSRVYAGGDQSASHRWALDSPLSCYRLFERLGLAQRGILEIELSSGATITPDTTLDGLFAQAYIGLLGDSQAGAILGEADRVQLAFLLSGLYNNDVISSCTNPAFSAPIRNPEGPGVKAPSTSGDLAAKRLAKAKAKAKAKKNQQKKNVRKVVRSKKASNKR